jgi:hypothetical protein
MPVTKEQRRQQYLKNPDYYKAAVKIKRDRIKEWLRKQKEVPCADCDVSYPYYVMDFDHRVGVTKVGTVNDILRQNAWARLREEIAKCDVVCSNCHRIRTQMRLGAKEVQKDRTSPLTH